MRTCLDKDVGVGCVLLRQLACLRGQLKGKKKKMFAVLAFALSVFATFVDGSLDKEEALQTHIDTLTKLVKAQAQRIEELEASNSNRRSLSSYDGKDCADIYVKNPKAQDGVYTIKPDGIAKPFRARCLMSSPAGHGWTKIMYFPSARKLTPDAVGEVPSTHTSVGKYSDKVINALMGGHKEMLAVMPNDPKNWIKVKWGAKWFFKDTRKSGEAGGFCQDTKGSITGPQITDSCGWDDPATYKDSGNAGSSYCWADHGKGAKKWHGIDLQNDGNGQSNAQNCKGGQVPHVMYVRSQLDTIYLAGGNGKTCDAVCKATGRKCIPFRVPLSKGDIEAAFKSVYVYGGEGCKVTDMRSGSHPKLSIWYRTVDKSSSVYGKCYAYAGAMTHCTAHGSDNDDGNLCTCDDPKAKPIAPGTFVLGAENTNCETACKSKGRKCLPYEVRDTLP